ncbi:MAG: hypothetical protein ACPL2N_03420 [Candidatus Cryosericum sp.]
MNEECIGKLLSGPIAVEQLEACVHSVLKSIAQTNSGSRIVLTSNGVKAGYLTETVPFDEVKVLRYWRGALGIKTELSYHNKFVGVLLLKK